jgi:hypothetical protein
MNLYWTKKRVLQLAMFSLIRSMRSDPEKYSALMYHNNDNQSSMSSTSRDNCNLLNTNNSRRQVVLPQAPYDDYRLFVKSQTKVSANNLQEICHHYLIYHYNTIINRSSISNKRTFFRKANSEFPTPFTAWSKSWMPWIPSLTLYIFFDSTSNLPEPQVGSDMLIPFLGSTKLTKIYSYASPKISSFSNLNCLILEN